VTLLALQTEVRPKDYLSPRAFRERGFALFLVATGVFIAIQNLG